VPALAGILLAVPTTSPAVEGPPQDELSQQIIAAARTAFVELKLFDGTVVAGRFRGFVGDWSDAAGGDKNYRRWHEENGSGLPGIGDTLRFRRVSGEAADAVFLGVGPSFLVLRELDRTHAASVDFVQIADLRLMRDSSATVPWPQAVARLLEAPRFVGVGLQQGDEVVVVPRSRILSASGDQRSDSATSHVVLAVCVGVVAVLVLGAVCVSAAVNETSNSLSSCTRTMGSSASLAPGRIVGDLTRGPGPFPKGMVDRP
jgi:hypothetical protein